MIGSYVILFTVCSFLGWAFESVFAIVRTGKWEARGFLYGPVCPIYGVGVVAIVLIAKAVLHYLGFGYEWWQIALVGFFGSMVLEYITSWLLEKAFHAYWWDYSNMPLNINGRTCIPAACLFSLGGLAAVYLVSPAWDYLMAFVPEIIVEAAAYVIVALFAIDATLTVSSLTKVQDQVAKVSESFNARAELLTDALVGKKGAVTDRLVSERDRLRDEVLQDALESMNASTRAALSRIKGFRLPEKPSASNLSAWANSLIEKARNMRKK